MNSTLIYIRTSTEEQSPELQLNGCLKIIERLNIDKDNYDVAEEKKSAFKDDNKREIFNDIILRIKKRNINTLIVWDLDRVYRNRKKLISFFKLCKIYNCKIYSFRQQFLEDINKAPAPWNEMLFDNLIFILGWIAEEESIKIGERISNAVRRKDKYGNITTTKSYKGNKWGRKEIKNKQMIKDILELNNQKLSMVKIAKRVYYYDKSNNKINPTSTTVWKIIKKYRKKVMDTATN